jgi:hypothetical protein
MRPPALFCVLLYLFVACTSKKQSGKTETPELRPSGISGKELAISHCSKCHGFVPPELLPKSGWLDVLPVMGHRLGIYSGGTRPDSLFDPGVSGIIARQANIFPEKPVLAKEDWAKIEKYFLDNAPDTILPPVRKNKIKMGLPHFNYRETQFSHKPSLTTLVKILPNKRGIVFADGKARQRVMTFLTTSLKEDYSVRLESTPVQFYENAGEMFLTMIGAGVFPTEAPDGAMYHLTKSGSPTRYQIGNMAISGLKRPVSMAYGDLDQDGISDVVACEFGNHTGQLAWYKNNGRGGYDRKVLREKPGAITAVVKDANNDGRLDIYVLTAQGDEGVFLYENQDNGQFLEKRLLSFLPLNGSQYIEVVDFNKDGFDDIVYVCGDNADVTPILKNYHGIYIYLNDGKSTFRQSLFYPLNGAYKAMVKDYDLDGDLDIAAISFFPDYQNYPEESFIYLKNKGNFKFDEYTFPQAPNGRWMVMDAEDMDADGDIDLVLGSFVYFIPKGDTTGLGQKWLTSGPSLIVLENTTR